MEVVTKTGQFVFAYEREPDAEMICEPAGNGVRVEVREKGADPKPYSFDTLPAPYGNPMQAAKTAHLKAGQISRSSTFDLKKRELLPASLEVVQINDPPNEPWTAKAVVKIGDRSSAGVMDAHFSMLELPDPLPTGEGAHAHASGGRCNKPPSPSTNPLIQPFPFAGAGGYDSLRWSGGDSGSSRPL